MQRDAQRHEKDKAGDCLLVHTTHSTLHFTIAGESGKGNLTLEETRS